MLSIISSDNVSFGTGLFSRKLEKIDKMTSPLSIILDFIIPIATLLVGSLLGSLFERRKQSLIIRSQLLEPLGDWLKGAEKMVGIFGDTVTAISMNRISPAGYNFEERRKAAAFMVEKTNEVFGILRSQSLQIRATKYLVQELNKTIYSLDNSIKYRMLPLDTEISKAGRLTDTSMNNIAELKKEIDNDLQQAHSLIAQIKTSFS
jgi:hypothetical protein